MSYILPIALVVVSNIIYQICAKSVPETINPLAFLTVTYVVGALVSFVLYFILNRGGNLLQEYRHLNWTPFVQGLVIIGLELGYIYAYKAGWPVSTASLVQSVFVAAALLFIGFLFYKEQLSWNKIAGVVICLVGLGLINK